jgi:hypothetical protein
MRFPARVDFLIEHMHPFLLAFDGWRTSPRVQVFTYEDYMVNPDEVLQRLKALGFGSVLEMARRSRERAYTFRKGTIENWKLEFSPVQKRDALVNFGDIIDKWSAHV